MPVAEIDSELLRVSRFDRDPRILQKRARSLLVGSVCEMSPGLLMGSLKTGSKERHQGVNDSDDHPDYVDGADGDTQIYCPRTEEGCQCDSNPCLGK